ncbi:hypothetical protein BRUM_0363 [Bifidobacterium ruminantium]|uniref:Uncharacterized protein n=2 Tax=Bifidobacterium TaxID=1678 RepID=A0A087D4Z4_BIFRU|nr:hypothetical protein BRUM_0363 [Bifidobacterium ruminantium]
MPGSEIRMPAQPARQADPYNKMRCQANVWQTGNVPRLGVVWEVIRTIGHHKERRGHWTNGGWALRIVFCPNSVRSINP